MKTRYYLWVLYVVGLGLVGWYGYGYLFDTAAPLVSMSGIEEGGYCAGDTKCLLATDKSGSIVLSLDDAPLPNVMITKVGSGEYQFVLPMHHIDDGGHTLSVTFTDGTFHRNAVTIKRNFVVDNIPLAATFIPTDMQQSVYQGRTVHVQIQTNKPLKSAEVRALSRTYSCVPESVGSRIYECFIPIACEEQPNDYIVAVDVTDKVGNVAHLDRAITVAAFPFKKQTLRVDQEKMKHEQEVSGNDKKLEDLLVQLTEASPHEKLWRGSFCAPIEIQRVTCDFGTIRTTQHKGRYAHKAVDVINVPRSVVWAPQDGKVVLKDRFAVSGNTVVIDHGCGILSMMFHLEDFADIKVGDVIVQGNPIGTLGKTGHATGYHLHWEMRIDNIPVDPLEWIAPTF